MQKYDLFISYSRVDATEVFRRVELLQQAGFSVWIDRTGIESGDAFKQVIFDAIERSEFFLFFSSKSSNASSWTAKEIGVAVSLKKRIFPIKLDNSSPVKEVLFDIINLDYCDLTDPGTREEEFQDLIQTLIRKGSLTKRKTEQSTSITRKRREKNVRILGLIVSIIAIFGIGLLLYKVFDNKDVLAIPAKRGRILDEYGRTLAYSEVRYDILLHNSTIPKKKKEEYYRDVSGSLADVLGDKNAYQYYSQIASALADSSGYIIVAKDIADSIRVLIETSSISQREAYNYLVFKPHDVRRYPYGDLAKAYIGTIPQFGEHRIGSLESVYDSELSGVDGQQNYNNLFKRIIPPKHGVDVRTTLNLDFQLFGDKILRDCLKQDDCFAEGTLVIMEVSTGSVEAVVNLSKDAESGEIRERINHALTRLFEPGSTFKTITLLSVLKDGFIKSTLDSIPTNHGTLLPVRQDAHIIDYERRTGKNMISIQDGFNISSNYVFAYLGSLYSDNPDLYYTNLYNFGLNENLCPDLHLPSPIVVSPQSKAFSPSSIITTAYGYGVAITPFHLISFYNAIANHGVLISPRLIYGFERDGKYESKVPPKVIGSICSAEMSNELIDALHETVLFGTARRLKDYHIAGKTGTTRLAFNKEGSSQFVDDSGNRVTLGSFIGFFPEDNPKYTVFIDLVTYPTTKTYYGGTWPALVAGEIVHAFFEWNPYLKEDATWNNQ